MTLLYYSVTSGTLQRETNRLAAYHVVYDEAGGNGQAGIHQLVTLGNQASPWQLTADTVQGAFDMSLHEPRQEGREKRKNLVLMIEAAGINRVAFYSLTSGFQPFPKT